MLGQLITESWPLSSRWTSQSVVVSPITKCDGMHWITQTADVSGATLLHNNKNECCLFERWTCFFFSLSPTGMKLGSTPRQSREVYLYSISPKTLVHRLLVDVICRTGVIVRLVSVSASNSICVNTPRSEPVTLYPLDRGQQMPNGIIECFYDCWLVKQLVISV